MTVDFHTHTHHSFDCMMQPAKILALAKKRGLNAIVINDHNTIKGGLECQALNKDANFRVIVGSEIKVKKVGDVTGIFLKQEIAAGTFSEVITEIKRQGGITILNHPYIDHDLSEVNFDGIDLIEGFNGRTSPEKNDMAIALAKKYGKPVIAGSDAHTYAEIANCRTFYNNFDNLLLPVSTEYKYCPAWAPVVSQLIKSVKLKDAGLLVKVLLGAPRRLTRTKKF